jgi:predicted ATPase
LEEQITSKNGSKNTFEEAITAVNASKKGYEELSFERTSIKKAACG